MHAQKEKRPFALSILIKRGILTDAMITDDSFCLLFEARKFKKTDEIHIVWLTPPLWRLKHRGRKAKLHPNIRHSRGKVVGLISANRALIVCLLKSITRSSGSILFALQLPCYAVYCCVCSMRTCHSLAVVGSRWKARQCVTVLLKWGLIIRCLHVKMFWTNFSDKPSSTTPSGILGACHAHCSHVLLG